MDKELRRALGAALQGLLDRTAAGDPAVPGAILQVEAPGFAWAGASGFADPDRQDVLLPDDQFQAASVTKMLTATTVLLLAEDGAVDLDAGIGRVLPASVTDGLHDLEGRAWGAGLTPRQLLSHTSGVADFFGDGAPGPDGALPFVAKMREDPDRLWDPLEILDWTKRTLHPHFPPGQGWHYADTGFLLAGLMIEALGQAGLHDVMRARLFEPLGMDHTYLLFREPARPGTGRPPSRAYTGSAPYGLDRSVSADWASGGLVTTAGDLARFIRAFADDRIFRDPATKAQMLAATATGEPGVFYGLGVRLFALDELDMPGFGTLWGHTGFIKSFALYWPERDATICGTLNQSAAAGVFSRLRPVTALVPATLRTLRNHLS